MPETPPSLPAQTAAEREGSSWLQWFREIITGVISLTILIVAAITIYGTWSAGGAVSEDEKKSAAQKEAYDRQKDIMLYAVALLGTVTGYYLGRVPAELHAQQAQKSATEAQEQLKTTQDKLNDSSTTVVAAQGAQQAAEDKTRRARLTLEAVNQTLASTLTAAPRVRGLDAQPDDLATEPLRRAKAEVEATLRDL